VHSERIGKLLDVIREVGDRSPRVEVGPAEPGTVDDEVPDPQRRDRGVEHRRPPPRRADRAVEV
jgi:hypothetical protein